MGRYKKLEQMANESMDILIPFFSALYSISIRKPEVMAPVWKKEKDFSGLFTPEGRNGIIELNIAYCKTKEGCGLIVAHELGHSATYQHHLRYFTETGDKTKDFLYDAIREGIAMEFEKNGLEALLDAAWITKQGFDSEIQFCKKDLSYDSIFKMGHRIVNFLQQRTSMKEIICSPEQYFDAIMLEYGKKVVSMMKRIRK